MKKYLVATGLVASIFVGAVALPAVAESASKHSISNKKDGWVQFDAGSATLSQAAKSELRHIVKINANAKSFKVTGYVQRSGSNSNNGKLSKARAASVKNYLRSLGVTVPITIRGAKVPKKSGSKVSARRAVIEAVKASSTTPVAPTPIAPSPSPSPDVLGSISGTIQRFHPYDTCADVQLDYVKLYEGTTLIRNVEAPTWSSTANRICDYAYSFTDLPNGTYTVEESFTQNGEVPWNVNGVEQPAWTVVGDTRWDAINEVRRIEGVVISGGADVVGIDLRMYNAD